MPNNPFDLTGKKALVTGGSRGIGMEIARGFVQAGADVVLSARNEEELQAAATEIRGSSTATVDYVVADMASRDDVQRLASESVAKLGQIDILVNNAGTNVPQVLEEITEEAWDKLLEINFTSCMLLTKLLAPKMKERRWGRILYISSIMGITANPQRSAYCGTKAALVGMAHSQALELGPHGVTVNCISPGPIATKLPMSIFTEEQKQSLANRSALLRWGKPEELSGPTLMLASEAGSYITGINLVVDGGSIIKWL